MTAVQSTREGFLIAGGNLGAGKLERVLLKSDANCSFSLRGSWYLALCPLPLWSEHLISSFTTGNQWLVLSANGEPGPDQAPQGG